MTTHEFLATQFEGHRPHLKSVAYRMLGSLAEAEDAVQESWLRLARSDSAGIGNLGAWLTTVVGRVSLDMLRARKVRREDSLEARLPDPVVTRDDAADPEQEVLLADSVGLALQVVLESLTPAERLAFVLHDMFGLPFAEIAPIVDRTPSAAKKLASRARQRVRGQAPNTDPDLAGQRRVADAFNAAANSGDFEALVAILDPNVVLRVDGGVLTGGLQSIHGAETVAQSAATFRRGVGSGVVAYPVLVNGSAGMINTVHGEVVAVGSFTITDGKIAAIDILTDPDRLPRLDLAGVIR